MAKGNNGFPTGPGYDLDTGIGSPRANESDPLPVAVRSGPRGRIEQTRRPARSSRATPPTTFSLTFSEPIELSSIVASDFTVDGIPADSASLSPDGDDDHLHVQHVARHPARPRDDEPARRQRHRCRRWAAEPSHFSANFYYVITQLQVSATSPPVGSVLTIPVTDLVVQFNKAFDPY